MAGLLLKGVLTFALILQSHAFLSVLARSAHFGAGTPLFDWINHVHLTLAATGGTAPFLAYSTDSLALAYILFGILFLGPYRDPVRNEWIINFGLLGCVGIFLLAVIAGPLRNIPVFWRWINTSFALACALPLLLCRHYLKLLKHIDHTAQRQRIRKTRRIRLKRQIRNRRSHL